MSPPIFFNVESAMEALVTNRPIARALLFVAVFTASFVRAGEMNGPMSSTPQPGTQPTPEAAAAAGSSGALDVEKLFANVCGWCHSNGGRVAGKGPQLMGTTLTDAEITRRIMLGKPGAMPAFAGTFNGDQIAAIIKYIRELKPAGTPK